MLAAPPNRALNPSSSWWGVLNDGYYHRFTFIEFEKLRGKASSGYAAGLATAVIGVFSRQMRTLIVLATVLFAAIGLNAQTCPAHDDKGLGEALEPSVLHGHFLLHDELRKWLGIKLDQPVCGQTEVQLIFSKADKWREAETLRGCAVTATGKLFDSPTGYYSADMAISDATLKPDASCRPIPITPDPYAVAIPPTVNSYHASITVDYRGKGHIDVRVWQGDDKPALLTPWQAYVSYTLTGAGDVIWLDCQKGFRIKGITQTPRNPNGIIEDSFLTGTVLQDISGRNVIKFACQRKSEDAHPQAKSPQSTPK
jgi:hypothetical protein